MHIYIVLHGLVFCIIYSGLTRLEEKGRELNCKSPALESVKIAFSGFWDYNRFGLS